MNAAEMQQARDWLFENYPHVDEVDGPSFAYNCHGYVYANAHGWFDEAELFLEDDFYDIPFRKARRGDVIVYMNGENVAHSAFVHLVRKRKIKKVKSKWGPYSVVVHKLTDVPHPAYGEPVRLLRRRAPRP
jgi:hypothetical protein